jgi:hypothetical protein
MANRKIGSFVVIFVLWFQDNDTKMSAKAKLMTSRPDFDFMKERFSWLRATLAVTIETATQTW